MTLSLFDRKSLVMMKFTIGLMSAFALTACGGGGGGGNPTPSDYVSFLDPTSMETAALSTISISSTGASSSADTVEGANGTITLGGLAGQFNQDKDRITFTIDGGFADILQTQTTYVALFNAQPNSTAPFLGIVGVLTEGPDLPSEGSVDYAGTQSARFFIVDADEGAAFDVTGDVGVTVNFDTDFVDLTFDNLNGTKVIGVGPETVVTNLGVIEIDDAELLAGVFTGGTAEFTGSSDITATLTGSETVTTNGTFFGPDGAEVAGIVIIDDSSDALTISGGFTAN